MSRNPPSSQAVLDVLLQRHGLLEPDGRPLYRYGARERELTRLRHALAEELGWPSPRRWTTMGFCLWASEWWRRNYKSGPWKWEGLLTELDHLEFAPGNARYLQLQDIVSQGVGAWKRQVLRLGPSRRYLATLACEGGLPLSLLATDRHTHLRTYMKAVMDEYKLFHSSGKQPQELAEQARHFLPRSWRQHVVYELAGQLVSRIWRLQQVVGESATPVIDLDRIRPGWRDELPVRLTEEIARTLLNGMLLDAAEVARGGRIRVRWNVEVVPTSDNSQWKARGSFSFPVTMDSLSLNKLFGRATDAPVPDRFDLCVQVHGGAMQPLAVVTPRSTYESRTWGVELLSSARKHHTTGLERPRDLVARSLDDCFRTCDFPGASGLTELPWVFTPKDVGADAQQPCRLVAQGSVKIREPWGLVAAPSSDASPVALEGSSVETLGILRDAGRRMYRVTGRVAFAAGDGSQVVVETGADLSTSDVEYSLYGKQRFFGCNGLRVYLGEPVMRQWHDGDVELIPKESLEWKPDVPGSRWEPYARSESARGSGTLRYTTAGEVRHTTRLCVLPEDAQIEILPSSDPQRGVILLRDFGDVIVGTRDIAGVRTRCVVNGTSHCLTLTAEDEVPREVAVIVDFGYGRAELRLPFPVRRAAFVDAAGDELPSATIVPMDRLTGIRAEAVIPGRAEFSVQGQYSGSDASDLKRSHGLFIQPMEEIDHGHHILDLARVQPAVDARLSRSDDLDGRVTLGISSNQRAGSLAPTQIKVGRFDLELQASDGHPVDFRLVGATTSEAGNSEQEVADLEIEALPLLNPGMEPIPLVWRDHVWFFPEDAVSSGPYLITGRQGDWQCVKPLTWHAGERDVDAPLDATSVEEAYAQWGSDTEELEAFRSVSHRLANKPDGADRGWELAFAYLNETALPVQVFPLLSALVATPQVCAMAAVIATAGQFDVLWRRMTAFPFAWWQVPMSEWEAAFTRYVEHMKSELGTLDDHDQADSILTKDFASRLDRIAGQLPGLDVGLNFLRARLLGVPIPSTSARITNLQMLDCLQKTYNGHRRTCSVRHENRSRVPHLPGIRSYIRELKNNNSWSEYLFVNRVGLFSKLAFADYVDAPAATAVAVMSSLELPCDLARAIREVRENQPEWFDEALRLAQLIAFGRERSDGIRKAIE